MKKKSLIISIAIITIVIIAIGIFFMTNNKEYPDDENTLYSVKFGDIKLRFERYDYSLGQNQITGVEKSTNNGKTYEKLTKEPITVSMEPKFIFLDEKLGFAIAKANLTKSNHYMGVKVTKDGGKTFVDSTINYDNPNIEILTVEDVPYYENEQLKLPCSIYQVKEDHSGYEDVDIIFTSNDNGLTWNILNDNKSNNRKENIANLLKEKMIEKGYLDKNNLESFSVLKILVDGYYKENVNKKNAQVNFIYTCKDKTKSCINNIGHHNEEDKYYTLWIITDEEEIYDIMNGITLYKSDIDNGIYIRNTEIIE